MKRSIILLLLFGLFTLNSSGQDGASIFKKNCAVCHSIGKGKLVGPDLKGVDKKYEIKWLTKWVKSSQSLVKKNDPKAVQIFNDNNKMVMPDQALSDDEIKAIASFIGEETTKLEQPIAVSPPPVVATNESVSTNQPEEQSHDRVSATTIIYVLVGINLFLILIIVGLGRVIIDLANYSRGKIEG